MQGRSCPSTKTQIPSQRYNTDWNYTILLLPTTKSDQFLQCFKLLEPNVSQKTRGFIFLRGKMGHIQLYFYTCNFYIQRYMCSMAKIAIYPPAHNHARMYKIINLLFKFSHLSNPLNATESVELTVFG